MAQITLKVSHRDGDQFQNVTISPEATIAELLNVIGISDYNGFRLVIDEGAQQHPHHRTLSECGVKEGHHVHLHRHTIHYSVDNEPQETTAHRLTAEQVMEHAKVDPSKHFLIRLKPHGGEVSYRENPKAEIHLHDGMRFLTASTGPTPVS